MILDEVQRAPELFLPLKAEVDRDRRPGRYFLTGSTSALVLSELVKQWGWSRTKPGLRHFHGGRKTVPFARNLHALPLSALWQLRSSSA